MPDDVADRDRNLALMCQRHHEIPVTTHAHRLTAGLVDRRDNRRGRPVVEIEQMVLEVHRDPMFTLSVADTVGSRLGDLGNLCGPIEFSGFEFTRRRPQHPERTDDLSVPTAPWLADALPHRLVRFGHLMPIARAETERVR